MALLTEMVIWVIFCYIGIPTIIIFIIIALRRMWLERPLPRPAPAPAPRPPRRVKPPKVAKVDPPKAKPAEPVMWPRWDGTHKWVTAQDKKAWDRDFDEAEARAWQQPQPAPTEEDVFARLRSELQHLEDLS